MTTQEIAQKMVDAFESRTRPTTGETFYALRDTPDKEWMQDIVREAHGDMLPDDFKYRTVLAVCEALADGTDLEDGLHEWADSQVDIYNGELTAWLDSAPTDRGAYVDEAREEFGLVGDESLLNQIGRGQFMEIIEIANSVATSLAAAAEDGVTA